MHPGANPFDIIHLNGLQQTLWPDHCVQRSFGADFPVTLNMNRTETIFRKGTDSEIDSYSGFYDNRHLKSTGLAGYLRDKNVKEIYISGLAGEICVLNTALDGLGQKFTTLIIEDATRPLSPENFKKAMKDFTEKGGRLIQSNEV